jgi:hypothetical protein
MPDAIELRRSAEIAHPKMHNHKIDRTPTFPKQ